jgi:hypothetical protein
MGLFHDLRTSKMGERNGSSSCPFRDEYLPVLAEAFAGLVDPETKATLEPPRSLLFWTEGLMVKCCLGAGENWDKWFWSFQGLDAGLEKVEEALRSGKGDWVDPRGKRTRLTR